MRLFVALALPDAIAASLLRLQVGVPGARWEPRERLHLTLRFIGEADGALSADIDDVLSALDVSGFEMALHGVGAFGDRIPQSLWAGVRDPAPLRHLQRKIESALQRLGLEADGRKFSPHVTLARLKRTPRGAVADFLSDHALYASEPFAVTRFVLFSSTLSPSGSKYAVEQEYALRKYR
jgi:RNA 2',3'-cyclic 3'-phosphodiesterase